MTDNDDCVVNVLSRPLGANGLKALTSGNVLQGLIPGLPDLPEELLVLHGEPPLLVGLLLVEVLQLPVLL